MKWQLSAIADAIGGTLKGPDAAVTGVSTDTRNIAPGQLFIALSGERFDAHDFLDTARAAGAAGLLISRTDALTNGTPTILVKDTRLALGQLAAAWRARFSLPLIGLTGSNGKTTTKEMINAILRAAHGDKVLATQGNLNNDIGLPLTLLGLHPEHQSAVVEMGMNHPGEISYLSRIAKPTVAVVTNAQRAHLKGVGTVADVAREKGCIYEGLSADGTAVINVDDPYAPMWKEIASSHRQLTAALDHGADIKGSATLHGLETYLSLETPWGKGEVTLQMPGIHNARNATLAAAASLATGISLEKVLSGLGTLSGVPGRLQKRKGCKGATILDDSYNANPDSFRAGIDVLAETVGQTILVMGDMGEIGRGSAQFHDEIGGYAKSQGIDRLFSLGDSSQLAARNFGDKARHFREVSELITELKKELGPTTTVLVKGSRFMRMERVVQAITPSEEAM